MALILKLNWK